jgi:hypothetical protein
VRVHRRSHRYSRRRSSIRRRRSKAHERRWHGLPRSLGVDDWRGQPFTRWWTIRGCKRCSSRTWRNRCRCGHVWRCWGRLGHVRHNRRHQGRTGRNPGGTTDAGRGATSGSKPEGTTGVGWQAAVVVEPARGVGSR